MKIKTIICSTIIAGLLAFPALVKGEDTDKDGQKVELKDLPVAVQNTITGNLNGGTLTELEKETKGGVVTYEADVTGADGKKTEIKVAADGTLIKAKADDDDDDKSKAGHKDDDDK
jgi:hypothetical protein